MKYSAVAIILTFVFMEDQKTILVAPLNWGLGHATRCVPVIKALQENNYNPLLASDGAALALLRKEFPELETVELPSYNITYSKKASGFKWKLLLDSPKMLKTIKAEKKLVKKLVANHQIQGIISDNRLGVRNKNIPSAYITHQLSVLTGSTTWLSTKLHLDFVRKFDVCWVPDLAGSANLSGKLGHPEQLPLGVTYMGPLSRMNKLHLRIRYDILVLLSGPEPQRTYLEEKLMKELHVTDKKVLFVLGKVEEKQHCYNKGNFRVYNFMSTKALEKAINESELIISRSGYTTIMDLALLEKKAFFIPTPGQYEQEYLAKKLDESGVVPYCNQEEFTFKKLNNVSNYSGLKSLQQEVDFNSLFRLFERKGKL
ncbi:glycosyltransferase [uncultured Planktosalinus sp.]|uniref:glycosyltransferase n=1 Tax=uncultured Planktosalinus sp. TaxID=1810935 RepID=UPI0030DA3DF6